MSSGKKNKKKWKPIAVEKILPNAVVRTTTSWAEEVENELLSEYTIKKISTISLPTAPRAACDLVIDETKIPPNGPFMAYLSNLPYDITEEDIMQQFKELKIANVQLPKDVRQDRMRGFGYIEFADKSSLLVSLYRGEMTLKGRPVRISLPNDDEQNKDKGGRSGGTSFTRNRDASDRFERSDKPIDWRAGAPIPHDPEKSVPKHSVGFTRQQNHRDREMSGGPFRESRNNFASDFDKMGSSFSRAFRDRDERDGGRSSDRGGNRIFNKRFDRDDRGSGRPSMFGRKFDKDDREREFKRGEPVTVEKEEPKTRPRIEIQPRSVPIDPNPAPGALPSSIFGAAKPVDTSKKEKEIERKLTLSSTLPSTRSSGATPRSTPTPNRSRSSSVSSLSCSRRQESEITETANESSKLNQFENNKSDVLGNVKPEGEQPKEQEFIEPPPPPTNVWNQRKIALAAASVEQNNPKETFTVVEKTTMSENAADPKADIRSQSEVVSSSNNTEVTALKWITFSKDSYSGLNHYGGRYSENNKFSSFNRDNRHDQRKYSRRDYENRDNDRRDSDRRSESRYFKNRGDNYGSHRSELNSFSNKRVHNKDGSFKSRNGGTARRYDRDEGRNSSSNYRERNDYHSTGSNRSSGSSMNNLRDDVEGTREKQEERKINDERLISNDVNVNDSGIQEDKKSSDPFDDRLKTNVDSTKLLENGNKKETGDDNASKQSTENITNLNLQSEEKDVSFCSSKSRKKDKKKKNQEKLENSNDKEILKPIENERKINNQKEDRKRIPDNQINEKSSNNNAKPKDNRSKKQMKKSRDSSDVPQMTKQKEEKTPNFRDLNRFQVLNDE